MYLSVSDKKITQKNKFNENKDFFIFTKYLQNLHTSNIK